MIMTAFLLSKPTTSAVADDGARDDTVVEMQWQGTES